MNKKNNTEIEYENFIHLSDKIAKEIFEKTSNIMGDNFFKNEKNNTKVNVGEIVNVIINSHIKSILELIYSLSMLSKERKNEKAHNSCQAMINAIKKASDSIKGFYDEKMKEFNSEQK